MPRAPRARTVDWDWLVFLSDAKVAAMPAVALGVWTRILGALQLAERPGRLKGDESALVRAGQASAEEWTLAREHVLGCLSREDPFWIHRKTAREHRRQTARIRSITRQREAASKSRWKRRLDPGRNATALQPDSNRNATAIRMQSPLTPYPLLPTPESPTDVGSKVVRSSGPKGQDSRARTRAEPDGSPTETHSAIRSLVPQLAELAKPHGSSVQQEVLRLCMWLAKHGLVHPGLLRRFAECFLERRDRIANPFAYFNPNGAGFAAMKMRLAADHAEAEHAALLAAERAWIAEQLGPLHAH